jgi:hypothetical protein
MINDLTPVLQQLTETNKNINELAVSINNLSIELRHSNANIKRIEEKELVDFECRLMRLEDCERDRKLREARLQGVEDTEGKYKAFLIANWQKLLMTLLAAAPVIAYVTKIVDEGGLG